LLRCFQSSFPSLPPFPALPTTPVAQAAARDLFLSNHHLRAPLRRRRHVHGPSPGPSNGSTVVLSAQDGAASYPSCADFNWSSIPFSLGHRPRARAAMTREAARNFSLPAPSSPPCVDSNWSSIPSPPQTPYRSGARAAAKSSMLPPFPSSDVALPV
jgi:hypothetical protein